MRFLRFFLPCLALAGAACQRTPDRTTTAPVNSSTIPDAPLRDTRWVLRQVGGQAVPTEPEDLKQPYLLISGAGTAEGHAGCNRFRASLKPATDDGELQLTPLASTRMACPELVTEQAFTQALEATRAYRITGNLLLLYGDMDRTGTPLAQLEAIYLR